MKTEIAIGLTLAFSTLLATGVMAQTKYGSEAGWDILVKDNMGPGCLITKSNADGTQVQMGIDATAALRGYMALYTKADANVAANEKLAVLFDVDGQQFSGEAKGQAIDGYRGAFVWVNNADFIYDLAKKKAVTITPQGGNPIVVKLAGTDAAFKALRACQAAQ
ncbi:MULTISPECIES: hypothetical protein [Ensifer]|uniref:Uncharacterized protein n=2 Tax=Ensifer canadensis TaxID=555315 RepID=A0AAW4FJ15_9HYPH|nr:MULTISPECIES: hypothetical protein [Ensifer]MDP9634204.1 hypothetical protein [Ensifer adhaerens]KQU93600.1 hypothetical protein ASD00_23220 [Ensifer sp. Root31]KQW58591.1 hypothetical protein ASD02_06250 [Ensifer sp. Root1252]KQW74294.1 hypothetical protein ASD03_06890 [Ensifer sp. Root127]KQY78566.1 hypothetical protein ASD52_01555 [Ensifer sp. Root142]